ncbi:hypothetical protein BKA93DRAFT_821456 [Sparassis latifolia]|uniref:RING-type domain-containing protein n=1 Tax=Sparassis crispa TaxID=139825 RepID=A0A401GC85_9APHY|nr:hypothetical protein SCP_0209680 [Sparassis crispa]GBE79767.1 hypothetical protein SCP_0209680 [Sparassis crispa]
MDDPTDIFLTTQERIGLAISKLPTLTKSQIPLDDSCPICLISFKAIYDKPEDRENELVGLTPEPIPLGGVTKLDVCGHVFCREDLIEWIRGRHGTCPACRHTFLNVRPISDSDYESSDGDYVPGEDDEEEEEEDGFLDIDGFTDMDAEFDVDEMDLEVDAVSEFGGGVWDDEGEYEDADESMENLGLSDGDGSESLSEGELFVTPEENLLVDDAGVYDDETYLSAPEDDNAAEESK